jgi:hypothetical protein
MRKWQKNNLNKNSTLTFLPQVCIEKYLVQTAKRHMPWLPAQNTKMIVTVTTLHADT